MRNQKKAALNVRRIAITGILSALTVVLNYTPLAFMLIPGLPVHITFMHVPVIIGAIVEGPFVGGFIGLVFGLFSLYTATITPLPIAFAFLNPLVSVLPRVLIGIAAFYVYKFFRDVLKLKNNSVAVGAAAVAGTITNTAGVLGMIYFIYAARFLEALGITDIPAAAVIFGMALPNAPLELAAALLVCVPVVMAVKKAIKRQ